MTTLTLNPFQKLRIKATKDFKEGIKPVDGRQPIPDEVALAMIQELDVPKDALIGVYDAFLILTSHLREQGYTNIVVLENVHKNLTSLQQKYYDSVKSICDNSPTIKYYVPPMNNYNRCDMNFDVIIGNPPYQNGTHNSTTNSLWKEFLDRSFQMSDVVSLVLPDIALAPPTFSKYKNNITKVNVDIKKYFKGIGSGFCRLVLDKNPGDSTTIITLTDEIVVPIGSLNCVPGNFSNEILDDMNKYLTGSRDWNLTYEYESRKKIFCEDGKYDVLHTTKNGIFKTNAHHPNNDLIRVSVDVSGNPKFHFVKDMGLTQSHYWTVFDSEKEAQKYVEWGNSEEVQSFLKKVKWGGMNSALIIKNLV